MAVTMKKDGIKKQVTLIRIGQHGVRFKTLGGFGKAWGLDLILTPGLLCFSNPNEDVSSCWL